MTFTSGLPAYSGAKAISPPTVGQPKQLPYQLMPGHDAVHEAARPRIGGVAEAQRVEQRDRPRAHREDVAQDAAHPGGRALERLDERGVVVALDLEDHRPAVADVDGAGVLAGPLQDARARLGQAPTGRRASACRRSARTTERRRGRARCRSARAPARWMIRSYSSAVSPRPRARSSVTFGSPLSAQLASASGSVPSSTRLPRSELEDGQPVGTAQGGLRGALGMRHQPEHGSRPRSRSPRCSRASRWGWRPA